MLDLNFFSKVSPERQNETWYVYFSFDTSWSGEQRGDAGPVSPRWWLAQYWERLLRGVSVKVPPATSPPIIGSADTSRQREKRRYQAVS